MGIALVTEVTVVFLTYMVVNVPVQGPKLTAAERLEHWPLAVIGAAIVALGVLFVVRETRRARRREGAADRSPALPPDCDLPRIPRALLIERVPARWVKAAGVISLATIPVSVVLDASFLVAYAAFLSPWVAIVAIEAKAKLARDTLFACFGLLVILQLLHMVEHSTQVGQLLATDGALAESHGIIGQLDFELVHFVTDSALWISLGLLVIIFRGENAWLVVAFVAAALHQVEHNYLIWLNFFDNDFYLSGGVAGIMGENGLIGSPLDRPYLHYTYNFIVFVPMVIAIWDQARRVDSQRLGREGPATPQTAA